MPGNHPAKPHLTFGTLGLWLAASAAADWLLIRQARPHPASFLGWIGWAILLLSLHLTWLSLAHLLCGYLLRWRLAHPEPPAETTVEEPVAVLLCVRDDWMPAAAHAALATLRAQDHLFICDDSQSAASRAAVQAFAGTGAGRCTVLTRATLDGYKAGNLNHWLRRHGSQFPYFLVMDHDNVIDPRAVANGLRRLAADRSAAFIQFAHREALWDTTWFAKALGSSVRAIWWMQSLRAAYGLPTCFGHGVLFRTALVERVGGFPQTLTEDIAITLALLRHGFSGRYELAKPPSETVPETYAQFRTRYLRWCIGTVQSWLRRDTRPAGLQLVSPMALDGMLQALVLLYPIPVLLFGVGAALLGSASDAALRSLVVTATAWLSIACPMVPVFAVAKGPWDAARSAAAHALVYLSLIVPTVCALAAQAIHRRAAWLNTGNRLTRPAARLTAATLVEFALLLWLFRQLPNSLLAAPLVIGIAASLLLQARIGRAPVYR